MPYVCVMLLLQDSRILTNGPLVGLKRPAFNSARDRFLSSRVELRSATEILSFLMRDHSNLAAVLV